MFRYILLLSIAFLTYQCTDSASNTTDTAQETTTAPTQEDKEAIAKANGLKLSPDANAVLDTFNSIPIERLQYLWENCTFIDYVFNDLPISMSMEEQPTIRYILSQIAADPAPKKPSCQPIGKIFFEVDGNTDLEADLYFSNGCTYYLFREDNQVKYGNYMTPTGVQYLNQTFQKASGGQ